MTQSRQSGALDLLSGPWTAIWQQGANQGKELLDLIFQEGQVIGFGSDRDGEFQYSGSFTSTGTVNLGKVYTRPLGPVPARMTYLGQWHGRRILGCWVDDRSSTNAGPFRMWPGHGPDPGEVLEAEAEPGLEAELVTVQTLNNPEPALGIRSPLTQFIHLYGELDGKTWHAVVDIHAFALTAVYAC